MKNLMKILAASTLLLLAACADKTAPSIEPGNDGLLFVTSSNILSSNKQPLVLSRDSDIVFVLTDSATKVDVKITDNSGNLVKVLTRQAGDSIVIAPLGGTWNSTRYYITVNATLPDGTPVDLYFGNIQRELGLWMYKSNVYDVANSLGYQEVPADVGELQFLFDQTIDHVEALVFSLGGVAIATQTRIVEDSLIVIPQIDSLKYNNTYAVSFRAYTADGQVATYNFSFKVAGSALVPVATNVELVGSAVGTVTTGFGLQQTIWVKLSDTLDPDVNKMQWYNGNATIDLYASGTANLINASIEIAGDTLKITPNSILKNVTNGTTVGFYVTVRSVKGLTCNVHTVATVTSNDMYIVESNVQLASGLYRPFKVIGDSLVVTFSKPVDLSPDARTRFRVNNFVTNYTVSWSTDSMTATIKNVDTLAAATFGGASPYESGSITTRAYNGVSFSLTAKDGEETTVAPNDPIQIHTEYGLAIVKSNILHKHTNAQVVVTSSDEAMDTIAPSGSITVEFNRAVDTALIKSANPNTHFILVDGAATTVYLPVNLSFSADAMTVTVDPVMDLKPRKSYYLSVVSVPGLGIANAPAVGTISGKASGSGAANRLTNDALKVYYVPISISNLTTTISLDTTGIDDSVASAGSWLSVNNTSTNLRLLLTKPAWNKKHGDSVDAYEWRVRKTNSGITSGWFYNTTAPLATATFDTSVFVTTASNPPKMRINLDMSAQSFWNEIQTPNNGTNYSNTLSLFNDSSVIEVQYRAVNDDNQDGDYLDAGEQGVWSNSVKYADNVAPCDEDFVDKDDMGTTGWGGVNVNPNSTAVNRNRTALGATTYYITVTFPEDMDVTGAPTFTQYWEGVSAPATKPVLNAALSRWTNSRTYNIALDLSAGNNYNTGDGYFAISVAGMKDASGVVIAAHGDVGAAANGTSLAVAIGPDANNDDAASEDQGSNNVEGLLNF
jgi:hypothetical protein